MVDCADFDLAAAADLFSRLEAELLGALEPVGKGRAVANLVDATAEATPVVRTTAVYSQPAVCFTHTIRELTERVRALVEAKTGDSAPVPPFNNVMVEVYTTEYRKMGFHSDQAQDLADGSWIAILSVYDTPTAALRKLVIEDKANSGASKEIVMTHNSVLFFSLATNATLRHKIVLADNSQPGSGRWMGLTMRTSKLWITPASAQLRLATDAERAEFLRLRATENRTVGMFDWPPLAFTISPSDLLAPVRLDSASAADSLQH